VLAAVLKKEGEEVRTGELIGYVASADESLEPPAPPAPSPDHQPIPAGTTARLAPTAAIVEQGELGGVPVAASRGGQAVRRPLAEPLPRARRAIARTVARAAAIPQLTVTRELDATAAAAFPHSLSDLFAAAVARAAVSHPRFNAWLIDDELALLDRVGLAFAVDGPRGVVAPVLRDADRLPLAEIARRRRDLVVRALQGRLKQAELEDATISLSNLGPLGVDMVLPIVTPPQVAVVGLGRARESPGRVSITVSLVADHRVVDGADGARFLATVQAELNLLATSGTDDKERSG
jgi:pyruvate dehydrogenase E2 component (dihydrolipoamide acetyltransferase)